jgi:predicted esterase
MRSLTATAALLFATGFATAQAERYELGQRLKAFEAAWDQHPDAAARKRAVAGVGKVTTQFFSFQFGEAGRTLDDARFALESDKPPSDAVKWATALYPDVPKRLIVGADDLTVNLKSFYTVKGKRPDNLSVRLMVGGGKKLTANNAKPVTVKIEKLPVEVKVPVSKEAHSYDATLTMDVLVADKVVVTRTMGVSVFIEMPVSLIKEAQNWVLIRAKEEETLETHSYRERIKLLTDLINGAIPETDILACTRLGEMGEMTELHLKLSEPKFFTADRPGDHWVTVPTGEKDLTPCRLFVPKGLDAKRPVPLVVAMHGAGGSENLFFEGYGAGHIVKMCEKRGWLLVSPRAGLGFGLGGSVPVGEIIDKLAERYPIDAKNVFIVGHSMGAAMTIDAVQKYPGRFAAAAALGGGGRVRKAEAFAELPVFVGVGAQDFALRNAKALHKALTDGKAKNVTYKEYPDVEHLLITREALGDVFALFDTLSKR